MARKGSSPGMASALITSTPQGNYALLIGSLRYGLSQTWLGLSALVSLMPDVYVGIDYLDSDKLKQLTFHELAHASHYRLVGNAYWQDLTLLEITHDNENGQPYGDGTYAGAGQVALAESWAEHIGNIYADHVYQNNTNLDQSYQDKIEEATIFSGFIPNGLHNDLEDIGEFGTQNINDNVQDFTYNQMFYSLGSGTLTLQQYRDNLVNNHLGSTPNTVNQVDDLFNSY